MCRCNVANCGCDFPPPKAPLFDKLEVDCLIVKPPCTADGEEVVIGNPYYVPLRTSTGGKVYWVPMLLIGHIDGTGEFTITFPYSLVFRWSEKFCEPIHEVRARRPHFRVPIEHQNCDGGSVKFGDNPAIAIMPNVDLEVTVKSSRLEEIEKILVGAAQSLRHDPWLVSALKICCLDPNPREVP